MRCLVGLEALSKSLLKGERLEETIFQFSHAKESDFEESLSRRAPILQRCLKFLQAAASNRKYRYIPPILKFVRAANSLDAWLVSASSIVLPKLNNLYCTILAEADPASQHNSGKVNVAISSRVKRDIDAMGALSSVFDVCVSFCDLGDEDNQEHLGIFLKTSAAVLFGSDFQKKRDTLNETDYAMDELARHSSYALSNIMLTYPAVIPIAEAILGKRLRCLFRFLHSSPEMSVNRSLILMLRSLYKRYEIDRDGSKTYKDIIEEEFSCKGPGRESVLCLFKKIDLASEDADAQAENVSLKMHSRDNSEASFKSVNCRVQVKEQSASSRCRVPFRCASIDWNRNSFVVHRLNHKPECWPLFLVSQFDWKKGRNELHLQTEQYSKRSACRIVVRFNTNSASEAKKNIIQDRLRQVKERIHSCEDERPTFVTRKASLVDMSKKGPLAKEDGLSREEETAQTNGTKPSSGVRDNHILFDVTPHRIFSSGSHVPDKSIGMSTPSASTERCPPMQSEPKSFGTSRTDNDSRRSFPYKSGDCVLSLDHENEASLKGSVSPGESAENPSDGSPEKAGLSNEANHLSSGDDHCNEYDEKECQESEPSGIPQRKYTTGRFDMKREGKVDSGSQVNVTEEPMEIQDETEIAAGGETVSACKTKAALNGLTEEDEQIRHKLHSVVAKMLHWKREQFSKAVHDTELSIKSTRERCEKQDRELLALFANGMRKRSALHTKKIVGFAGQAKKVLLKIRKRLTSLRKKLLDSQRQLKFLNTKSTADIARAGDSMREERGGLRVKLDQSVAAARRRGESRARKNSVLQSLTRILKR